MSHPVVSWILTVSAIAVALCVAIVTLPLARYPTSTASGNAGSVTYMSALATTRDLSASAAANLSWSPRRTVTAVGLSGSVVTAVFVRPGVRLQCGSKVFEIDASPIFALCGPQPLWRVVSGGLRGDDVNEAVVFLRSRGWLASLHPSSASLTTRIERWQRAAGLPVTGRFSPASVFPTRSCLDREVPRAPHCGQASPAAHPKVAECRGHRRRELERDDRGSTAGGIDIAPNCERLPSLRL